MWKGTVKGRWKIGILSILFVLLTSIPFIGEEEERFVTASNDGTEEVTGSSLEDKLEQILEDPVLARSIVGVSVRKADTGEEIYEHHGDIQLHPASNMKLLTAGAALEVLGPDYRFTTEVLTDGKQRCKVLQGNLYLKGKGDPTLLKEDVAEIAKEIKNRGIEKINGDLIADDSWYDDVRLSQDLNWSDESNYTGAPVSTLTLSPNADYDTGTVIVEVTSGEKAGEAVKVNVEPETSAVTIVNRAKTVAAGEPKQITMEREHGTSDIVITGEMPLDGTRSRSWIAVWDPTIYAADVFKQALAEHGITFIGNSEMKHGVTPDEAKVLVTHTSMPLSEILLPFMKLSNNGLGEMLTKEMGQVVHGEGSWEKGLEVITDVVSSYGVDESSILLRDGSGMSHKTYIPASELTRFLYQIQEEDWYEAFEDSLPVAGMEERFVGGTLRNRMTSEPVKGNLFAKTGSLTSVNTLSGYVMTEDGEKLVFSIMNNNYISGSVTSIQDAMVTELVKHPTGNE